MTTGNTALSTHVVGPRTPEPLVQALEGAPLVMRSSPAAGAKGDEDRVAGYTGLLAGTIPFRGGCHGRSGVTYQSPPRGKPRGARGGAGMSSRKPRCLG